MSRIFQKERESLLAKNRFARYIVYAIGEIILVIIGILIALSINNNNELSKHHKRVDAILLNIQRDLETDLADLNAVISFYKRKDSLIDVAIQDSITVEDYKLNPELMTLLTIYSSVEIKDYAYQNLMRNSDYIPEKYNELILKLDDIYLENRHTLDEIQSQIKSLVNGTIKTWSTNYTWYLDLSLNRYNKDFVDYVLNDPIYKNQLMTLKLYSSGNLLRVLERHKLLTVQSYLEIHKHLAQETEVPLAISEYMVELTIEQMNEFVGYYAVNDVFSIHIYLEGNQLMGKASGQDPFELYTKDKTLLFNPVLGIELDFSKTRDDLNGFTLIQLGRETFFRRLEDDLKP